MLYQATTFSGLPRTTVPRLNLLELRQPSAQLGFVAFHFVGRLGLAQAAPDSMYLLPLPVRRSHAVPGENYPGYLGGPPVPCALFVGCVAVAVTVKALSSSPRKPTMESIRLAMP